MMGDILEPMPEVTNFYLILRIPEDLFSSFSLSTLLSSQINPEAIKDKIVLIGTKTEA